MDGNEPGWEEREEEEGCEEGAFRGWWTGKGWELKHFGTYPPPPRTLRNTELERETGWGGGGCRRARQSAAEKVSGELQLLLGGGCLRVTLGEVGWPQAPAHGGRCCVMSSAPGQVGGTFDRIFRMLVLLQPDNICALQWLASEGARTPDGRGAREAPWKLEPEACRAQS
jgi:hypothetical protein